MRALDSWLIDRVAQPLVNRIGMPVIDVMRACALGVILTVLYTIWAEWDEMGPADLGLQGFCVALLTVTYVWPDYAAGAHRVSYVMYLLRMNFLFFAGNCILGLILRRDSVAELISALLFLGYLYAQCCREPPPRRRVAPAPLGQTT